MPRARPAAPSTLDTRDEELLRTARRLAHWLDSAIPLPGGYRIGLDGIVGLIPGAGDAVGALLSTYVVTLAARLGVPSTVLLRMIGNVVLDTLVGFIPLLGDLFDFAYKSNRRNFALLEEHAGRAAPGRAGDRRLWGLTVVLAVLALVALVAMIYGAIALLAQLFN
jgi:hypothetical protein